MDEYRDFTLNQANFSGLPDYVNEIQDGGMHFIIILVSTVEVDFSLIMNFLGHNL